MLARLREVWAGVVEEDRERKPGRRMIIVDDGEADRVEVLYGGGSPDPSASHWEVADGTALARAMGLIKTTYFRHTNVAWVERTSLDHKCGECPYDEFTLEVEPVVEAYHRRYRR